MVCVDRYIGRMVLEMAKFLFIFMNYFDEKPEEDS